MKTCAVMVFAALLLAINGGVAVAKDKPEDLWKYEEPTLEVGHPFPIACLPDLDGKPRSVREYQGEKVVVHIFASW